MMIRLKNDGIATVSLNDIQLEMRDQVESKVKNGTYQLEEISCPVCQKVDREIVGEKDRYGLTCTTNLCRSCGLAYTSPRMVQEAFNDFYNKEYRKLYGGTIAATGEFFAQQEETGKKIYHFLESNDLLAGQSLSVFEVGCGAGGILNFFKKKGHKVSGIDLGEEYLKYGRKEHGLDIRGGTLADIELIQKPDLIIYSHVMEHILDLKREVECIKAACHENTVVYVEVPGLKAIHMAYRMDILTYLQNAHTFHFTLNSLCNIMKQGGFGLIVGNELVMSAFRISKAGEKSSNEFASTFSYLKRVEKYRKLFRVTPFAIKGKIRRLWSRLVKKSKY